MNFDEWAPLERRIRAAFPGFAPDVESQNVYLDVLSDVDAAVVERAVNELLREGHTEPPPPGVIRSRALGLDAAAPAAPAQPAPVAADTRDHGARRGLGWVGVVAAGALAVAVVAVVVALVDENNSDGGATAPNVTITQETPTVTVERPSVTVAPPEVELPSVTTP